MDGNILKSAVDFLQDRFSLRRDQEREDLIVAEIRKGVEFRGINVWVLVFAIMVASIGLNVNSTAVVIGAMLISPLMGPIMGVGLGVGISDVRLIKRASTNLAIMVVLSVVTSAIYFYFSPLQEENSELLGRTAPTIWDVFIGLFGGLAGIVAAASKEKGNVVPGVAIATALMPPLCTAGYGIAIGEMKYFAGAFYLFSINAVFICFATLVIVRFLRFHEVAFLSPKMKKRVRTVIGVFVVTMIIPSIYIAQNLVRETLFKKRAADYVHQVFKFPATNVLKTEAIYKQDGPVIEVWLRGVRLDANTIAQLQNQLTSFELHDVTLKIEQDPEQMTAADIKSEVLEKILTDNLDSLRSKEAKINYLKEQVISLQRNQLPVEKLSRESSRFDDKITGISIVQSVFFNPEGIPTDTVHVAITNFAESPKPEQVSRFAGWLKERLESDSLRVVVE